MGASGHNLQHACGEPIPELRAKKIAFLAGPGREASEEIRQGLQANGVTLSIAQLCRWSNAARRTVYYNAVRAFPELDPQFVASIEALI